MRGWFPKLDWIIVGGESGKGARPMHPDWARSIRDHCAAAGVPFFFKQWGAWGPDPGPPKHGPDLIMRGQAQCAVLKDGHWIYHASGYAPQDFSGPEWMYRLGKHRAGRLLDDVEHNGMPVPREVPFS
jgi:hypothetical protein